MTVKTSKRESVEKTGNEKAKGGDCFVPRNDKQNQIATPSAKARNDDGGRPELTKKYLSFIPMDGNDQVVVDDDMAILTLRTKVGNCNNEVSIGRVYTTVVGCGPVLKQVKARLMSITLEQNPGNISMDDAILALGKGIEDFRNSFREMYGELMLWRPAWKFEYQEVEKPKIKSLEVKNE
jgi:hypothetical protein